jgi:Ca2+-binding RTX toxin-like protein
MQGGAGDDTYLVDDAGDNVAENPGEGTDTVRSSVSFVLTANIENLTLTGTGNLNGTGNELDNIIVGNAVANTLSGGAGDDSIDGGAGADAMSGQAGDDAYVVDNSGDTVTEGLNAGSDTVTSSIGYTLGANLENLILAGTGNLNGTGNALDNTLTGNAGNNSLNGSAGADTLSGGAGNDSLAGGTGADRFYFNTAPGAANLETIVDFLPGEDLLVLNPEVFAAVGSVGGRLDPSTFRSGPGVTAAIDANDHVMYNSATGALYYDADASGTSSVSVQLAVLNGAPTIDSQDFLVARI